MVEVRFLVAAMYFQKASKEMQSRARRADGLGFVDGLAKGFEVAAEASRQRLVQSRLPKLLVALPRLIREKPSAQGEHEDREAGAGERGMALHPFAQPADGAHAPGRDREALHVTPQVLGHRPGRLVAAIGIFLQRLETDRFQVEGDGAVEAPG